MTTRSSSGSSPGGTGGVSQQARGEAANLGHEAQQASGQVTQEAVGQGRQVVAETRRQARNLTGEASAQLREQAGSQQKRIAEGLRAVGAELGSMAGSGDQQGVAREVVRRASDAAEQAAGWLEEREPGALVQEVRDYARRRPGVFLAGAAVAGLLVGRLTRNLAAAGDGAGAQRDDGSSGHRDRAAGTSPAPAVGVSPPSGRATGGATTSVPSSNREGPGG